MKSIVERAYDYADEKWGDIDEYHADTVAVSAYIAGAEEQKAIDEANYKQGYHDAIEKAKTAFGKACGWLSAYLWYNAVVEEFIKNMEE